MSAMRPNIVLIMADQMRGDCLGIAGHPVVETPVLDCLAARGAWFRHAYTAVPSCLPARAVFHTGFTPWHTGLLGMGEGQPAIPNDYPHTMAGELARAGYRTHLVGKGHFGPPRSPMGFESMELEEASRMTGPEKDDYRLWFAAHAPGPVTPDDHGVDSNSWQARPWHTEEWLHPTAWAVTRTIEFLEGRDRARPFFLNLSFVRPHSPYVPPAPYFDMYWRRTTPAPSVGDWAGVHDRPVTDPNAWRGRLSPERVHRARSGYLGEISFIDAQLDRLMMWIRRRDPALFGTTWFLFVSDHGDMQGDHHLWRKTYAYEGSARIPFIVAPPAGSGPVAAGRGVDGPVELRDVLPTVLEIAGVPVPTAVDGASLLPFVRGERPAWREYLHGEHSTCYAPEQEMQYVTDGRRKYVWLPRAGVHQFFDLEADPGETRDLAADPARREEAARWRDRLVRELASRDCGWVRDGRLAEPPPPGPLLSAWRDRHWRGPG